MERLTLFQDTYRIDSARAPGRDYGAVGKYFVTICTKSKIPWFGSIQDGRMFLSAAGCIADRCWRDIPTHFPHVIPDAYIIMPNHVHGIITIGPTPVETQNLASRPLSKPRPPTAEPVILFAPNRFGPQSRNLASIIRGFKIGVTIAARKCGYGDFQWHPRFHDHIIRDTDEYDRIQRYIALNPERWWEKRRK